MLKISKFTKLKIDKIKLFSNFTERENKLFDLRNSGKSLEECAEIMNVSVSTISRINREIRNKINEVIQ